MITKIYRGINMLIFAFLLIFCYNIHMTQSKNIKEIIQESTPRLEKVLATGELTAMYPEDLQLRLTQCGLGTAALQHYLLDQYDIATTRVINRLTDAPRGLNFRTDSHAVLRTDSDVIDPTYGQFMRYVGLTPTSAQHHNMTHLYPPRKIMVYSFENARAFADTFAAHAFSVDRSGLVPEAPVEYAPDGALRNKPLEEMQRVYRSIWNPGNYTPFPVEEQREDFQNAAKKIAKSMKYLDT